jgi:hypothetical protein
MHAQRKQKLLQNKNKNENISERYCHRVIKILVFLVILISFFFNGIRRVERAFDDETNEARTKTFTPNLGSGSSSSSSSSASKGNADINNVNDKKRDRATTIVKGNIARAEEEKEVNKRSSVSILPSAAADDDDDDDEQETTIVARVIISDIKNNNTPPPPVVKDDIESMKIGRAEQDKLLRMEVKEAIERMRTPPNKRTRNNNNNNNNNNNRQNSNKGDGEENNLLKRAKGTFEIRGNGRCVSQGLDQRELKVWRRLESVDDPLFIRVAGRYYDPKKTRNKPKTRSLIMHRSMFEPGVRVIKIDRFGERVEPGGSNADNSEGRANIDVLNNRKTGNSWQDEMSKRVATSEDEEIVLDFRGDLVEQLPREDEDENEFSFSSCAIVGNSGAILGKGYGKEIDANEAVWRVNYAPIDGFEKDVGYKTTFDLINQQHTKRFVRGDGEYSEEDDTEEGTTTTSSEQQNLSESDSESDEELKPKLVLKNGRGAKHASKRNSTLMVFEVTSNYARKHLYARLMRQRTNKGLKIWSPELVVHAQRSWELLSHLTAQKMGTSKTGKAMSGAYAVILASQICEEVHLYGFSPYKRRDIGQAVPYHYFDEIPAVLKHHSFDLAIEVFKTIRDWPCAGVKLEIHP